jgi:glycosyltransferase involved in cell wall biosynthesis
VLSPERCPYRRDVRRQDAPETAACDLLARAFDSAEERLVRVRREACEACCAADGTAHARHNPVLASLIYHRAHQHLAGRPTGPDAGRLARLKEEARARLLPASALAARTLGALGVLGAGERRLPAAVPCGWQLTWAVAVVTAPRTPPTLAATLDSLHRAGFEGLRLFAEPEAVVPASFSHLPLVRHRQRLGPVRNLCFAARALLDAHPDVECYAIFQDDISAAVGLRRWCDREFWPGGHGVVSLYTSRVFCDDRPGWQTLNLGRYRTFGALAFVFRGPTLREFLTDAEVRRHVERGDISADGAVGEWALKRGIGIAYHSPSLIQHEGETTSLAGHAIGRVGRAVAVERVDDVGVWRRSEPCFGRVGLVGWNTRTGLGYQNRDIAVHLPVARWLAPPHPRFDGLSRPRMAGEYRGLPTPKPAPAELRAWLRGLDWLLFVEHPYLPRVAQHARELGISVACVPNWEWLTTGLDWLPYVDLMICPTQMTYRMLRHWRRDLGFAWDVVYAPWPIDPRRFPYRRRERCRGFLFVNGTGGTRARRADGSPTGYHRKGVELLAATARILKAVPFLVYSQQSDLPPLPDNVEVREAPKDNRKLYADGDVCVLPSHWEGLGLQLLECQAAGLPLVTTDAPPMNECRPFRAVPAAETELVFVYGDQPVDAHLVRPEALAEVLHEIHGSDLREASERARAYIEQERSWPRLRETIAAWLTA